MAAVAYDTHDRRAARPSLRLVGGRGPSRAVVYRRRRLLALVVVMAAVVLAGLVVVPAVRAGLGAVGGGPLTPADAPTAPAMRAVAANVCVGQQGDTLWSIARRLQPAGVVRRLIGCLSSV